jgi:hypothetical protein
MACRRARTPPLVLAERGALAHLVALAEWADLVASLGWNVLCFNWAAWPNFIQLNLDASFMGIKYIDMALSPCSAELISTAYQPWNSVFLSQQISHSRLISQKTACRTGPILMRREMMRVSWE